MRLVLSLLAALCLASEAAAAPSCHRPPDLSPAPVEPVDPAEVQSGVAIAYYLLAISWTPDWRRINGQTKATTPPLDPEHRPQGFALHGLWPNGKAPPYPRYCRPVGPIDAATVRVPVTAIAVIEDLLVPLADMRAMVARMPRAELHEISSHFGHDAFLKEAAVLRPFLQEL